MGDLTIGLEVVLHFYHGFYRAVQKAGGMKFFNRLLKSLIFYSGNNYKEWRREAM